MIADPSDKLHRIIVDDVHRFFDTPNIKPRALLFCLFVDFWLGTLFFGPLIFMAFRGSWQVLYSRISQEILGPIL